MNNHDIRFHLYMMWNHLGEVMDGDANLDILELWHWMNDVLHKDNQEEE